MRHNIYLSDELSRAVQEAGISISTVCQTALKEEVRKVNARKEATQGLEQVALRLRETKREEDAWLEELGRREGVRWAREAATWHDLQDLLDEGGPGRDNGAWEWIGEVAREKELSDSDVSADSAFFGAFASGAEKVYNEVEPLV